MDINLLGFFINEEKEQIIKKFLEGEKITENEYYIAKDEIDEILSTL